MPILFKGEPLQCCHMEGDTGPRCDAPAEFMLVDGPAPDDYTHACEAHVGPMCQGDREVTVIPAKLVLSE